jgi:tRNA1(Val) A37 N6-methylase TrmN6
MDVTEGNLLGGKLRYRQFAAGHRSGFEPVLLAAAVPAKAGQRVLEAGTGAGAGLLCLGYRVPGIVGVGVEIDPALAGLANENFNINGLSDFYCMVGDATKPVLGQKFDHVMANPPWHDAASTNSPDAGRALAHHAEASLLEFWVKGLATCLKPHGSLTLILPAAALSGAVCYLRAQNCGAISLFPLWPRVGKPAKLVIITARKGGKGPDRVLPGLVLHDDNGITPEAQAVLQDGAALRSPER